MALVVEFVVLVLVVAPVIFALQLATVAGTVLQVPQLLAEPVIV